jgi:hypothetical protein
MISVYSLVQFQSGFSPRVSNLNNSLNQPRDNCRAKVLARSNYSGNKIVSVESAALTRNEEKELERT